MRCPACGADNTANARYCASCGIRMQAQSGGTEGVVYCTSCGTGNSPEAAICVSCGSGLVSHREPPRPSTVDREQVSVEYMGFWIRFFAQILDGAIFAIATIILLVLIGLVPFFIILFVPLFFYWLYKSIKCETLGRKIIGIQVVNASGERISFWEGLFREVIGKTVSAIFFYLGFIWVAFDRQKQGWHDKIASTYVVRKQH